MHITELLERAGPTPTRPLDMARVLAEARRPRWHKRRWLWVMGVVALGGAAVPAGINLAPASSPATRVETVRPRPEPRDSTRAPSTDVSPSATDAVSIASDGAPAVAPGDRGGPSVSTPSSTPLPAASPNQSAATGNDECVLQGGEVGVDTPPAWVGIGNYPRCTYTARSAGGYVANGSWQMTVTKPDGTVRYYGPGINSGPNQSGPACGNVGTVEPGDRVDVILYTGAENATNVYYVKVGSDFHC